MAKVRIKLGSLNIEELNNICGTIKELAKKSDSIHSRTN
jgi:ribosomal protein S10